MPHRISIVGASGYTGAELLRILSRHPAVTLSGLYARRAAGAKLDEVFPHFTGLLDLPVEAFDADAVAASADLVFAALPHGESAQIVTALIERGVKVVDLSADFRLRDPATYGQWYTGGQGHPNPSLLRQAVYGLPEHYRGGISSAQLVAAPGCYPTASILAVAPLIATKLVSPVGIIVDAKSGASGAGRSPGVATHFPEAGEGVRAYKVGGTHRHTPEIEQELSASAGAAVSLLFTPHLLPMSRGILSCVYTTPTHPDIDEATLRQALEEAYANEPFVDVLPAGRMPDTAHVRGSNRCHVQVVKDPRTQRVLSLSAIDNLVKGAAGQAVQCMNLMLGEDETAGLMAAPMFP